MIKDLNPLSTPKDVLTDCLNGTVITYNGDEFVLQNDMGNCKVDLAKLSPGFIPMGMKEYGGIVYVASLNPETGLCEIGSFPSPQEDFSTTDFGNIGPANFRNTDFTVDVGDDSVNEKTAKHDKLFEPEILQLHPGDLYVVTYTITDPSPPADPSNTKIDSETKYEHYITQDLTDRKLFRLVFSKISDNNNLVDLPAGEIKVIPYQVDLSEEYVYYKEPSQATLAVGLQLEQLDMFDASVVDASRNTDSNKKVGINAIGFGDSLNFFDGVRVKVTSPVTQTFFLEKQGSNKKVGAILDGLAANGNFQCSITPYSPYMLYPKLTKNYNLTLGQYLSAGSGINNIFLYYTDSTFIKMDFDYRFQGNTENGIHLYVEFYDPWSDYSVVKTVDNPTYYGLNSVIIETIDEPRVDVYNGTTVGGTPASLLITNPDTVYEKTLLNSTNLIRKDQTLRKNHFYIVRISGVDRSYDSTTDSFTYQHYDFYKGLYTTTMFNDVYTRQTALSTSDPTYVADFNSLDFVLTNLNYQTDITPVYNTPAVTVQVNEPADLMTNQEYYAVLTAAYSGGSTNYRAQSTFETDVEYNVQLTLEGEEQVFGNFKENMISAELPTLIPSDSGGSGVKPTIVEPVVPSTPATNSVASWTITSIGSNLYKLDLKLVTDRSVESPIIRDTDSSYIVGHIYTLVDIDQSFHYVTAGNSGLDSDPYATLEMGDKSTYGNVGPAYIRWQDDAGSYQFQDLSTTPPNGNKLYDIFNAYTKKWTAVWGGAVRRAQFLAWRGAPGQYGSTDGSTAGLKGHMLYFRNEGDSTYAACRCSDINIAKDFFSKVKVVSNVTKTLYLYYPDPTQIVFNDQLTTTATFADAKITTVFSPDIVSSVYIKTYLSTFRMHATGALHDFEPVILNNYIASRVSDSVILDGKQTIRDGFIPFITTPQTSDYTMVLDDVVITKPANSASITAFRDAMNEGRQDPAFVVPGDAKPHGTVTLADNTTQYASFLGNFTAKGFTAGVTIDPTKVYLTVTSSSGNWQGGWAGNGNSHWGNAPYLYQDLQIS